MKQKKLVELLVHRAYQTHIEKLKGENMIANTRMIQFKDISDGFGRLTPIESKKDIPFEIKRIYYITNVPENTIRGKHSHNDLKQILICLNGSVTIKVSTFNESEHIILNNPSVGLYIGSMVWREMYDFSPESVLLVLASEYYSEEDYIRNYDEYIKKAKLNERIGD